jgi:hypothetical protein
MQTNDKGGAENYKERQWKLEIGLKKKKSSVDHQAKRRKNPNPRKIGNRKPSGKREYGENPHMPKSHKPATWDRKNDHQQNNKNKITRVKYRKYKKRIQ